MCLPQPPEQLSLHKSAAAPASHLVFILSFVSGLLILECSGSIFFCSFFCLFFFCFEMGPHSIVMATSASKCVCYLLLQLLVYLCVSVFCVRLSWMQRFLWKPEEGAGSPGLEFL